ncbi:hypothetical protein ACLKA6_000671 [Drosophila palustris]
MDPEDIIEISDEEEEEPWPDVQVEDCSDLGTEPEGFDSDETEPRPEPRAGPSHRDPRRERPFYGRQRQEEPRMEYRHTLYQSTTRSVDHYDGLVVFMTAECSTLYIEVPHARNSPSRVEEPRSPSPVPAMIEAAAWSNSEAGTSRVWVGSRTDWSPYPSGPPVSPTAPASPRVGHTDPPLLLEELQPAQEGSYFGDAASSKQAEDPAEAQSDPEGSKIGLEDPSSPMEEVPPSSAHQEGPWVGHADPSRASEDPEAPQAAPESPRVDRADPSPPGRPNPETVHTEGGSLFWDKLPTNELEVDPESKFPCIRIRFKPGVVNNARLARNEGNTRARPRSTRRKRQHSREGARRARESGGSRKRRRSFPAETEAPSELTRQTSAEEDPPIPEEVAVGGEPASRSPDKVTSPTDSELLRDMEDMLDGWDPDLDAMFGEMADPTATLDPLIPRTWRVFPAGTVLSGPVIAMLQAEVKRMRNRHRRSRFKVADQNAEYTVTITITGAVTVTLVKKGGV